MAGTVLSDGNPLSHETITGRVTNGLSWKVLFTEYSRTERSHGHGLYLYYPWLLWSPRSKASRSWFAPRTLGFCLHGRRGRAISIEVLTPHKQQFVALDTSKISEKA